MEFQIEARRTLDIRNTRCRGCVGMPMQGSKRIESYREAKVKHMIYDHYQKISELKFNLNPKLDSTIHSK